MGFLGHSLSRFHQLDGGPPLEFINIHPPKRGSTSRIHQHTAPKRGSASRIHQHTAPKRGPPLKIHQHTVPKWGSASRIHQHQPKNGGLPLGTIFMDLAVSLMNWIRTLIISTTWCIFKSIFNDKTIIFKM